MKEITIRAPEPEDAAAITSIDAQGLASGHASFRNVPHDWDSFKASYLTGRGIAVIAEDRDVLVAWAGVSPISARAVYQGVGEISIYVSADRQGCGIGRFLLGALVVASEKAGYWTLVAQVFPENEASLSLHAALGFDVIGTRTKLGQMSYGPLAGCWRDVIMLERRSQIFG